MSMILRRAIQQSLSGGGLNITEVFSTDLWAGTGAAIDVINDINSIDNNSLVWIKGRDIAYDHRLFDTVRGATRYIQSNQSSAEVTDLDTLTDFNRDGFSIGADVRVNGAGFNYVGWSFRKAPKFFDVIKYTGDGIAGRQMPHELGTEVGMCIVKATSATASWFVTHREVGDPYMRLDTANPATGSTGRIMTDSYIELGAAVGDNVNGGEYIMYLFAHDPEPDGVIQCGQYVGNGTNSNFVDLETPWAEGIQYIMIKSATVAGDWCIFDTTRGLENDAPDKRLFADTSGVEFTTADYLNITPTGFELKNAAFLTNGNGEEYIYMAIRAPSA